MLLSGACFFVVYDFTRFGKITSMANVFAGKRIVVGVTGSIAAFKVAGWVSTMAKNEARVSVIMTDAAQKFITPLTFAALSGEAPYISMFEERMENAMSHIELAQDGSLFIIAPATAHTIARLAHGMADDLLSASFLATRAPVIVCPAMNSNMYLHPSVQKNLKQLRDLGCYIAEPGTGKMACKDEGQGRLIEWDDISDDIERYLHHQDLEGQTVLITAGPTREAMDPARFISNRSSGKMGFALAKAAYHRGAKVVLISGPTVLQVPDGIQRIDVESADQMYFAVMREAQYATIIVKSAAVSDFRPRSYNEDKVKKEDAELAIPLERNPDILLDLGKRYPDKFLVGFAAESKQIVEEGRKKLIRKNLKMVVANDICSPDSGFESDTNKVYLIDENEVNELHLSSKQETAHQIFDCITRKL